MNGKSLIFFLGLGLQIMGITLVGLCFMAGLSKGDYGKMELIQLVGGSLVFYLGQFFKVRVSK